MAQTVEPLQVHQLRIGETYVAIINGCSDAPCLEHPTIGFTSAVKEIYTTQHRNGRYITLSIIFENGVELSEAGRFHRFYPYKDWL